MKILIPVAVLFLQVVDSTDFTNILEFNLKVKAPEPGDCCCHEGPCDPCDSDPPEECADPLEGIDLNDPALTVLLQCHFPINDFDFWMDAFFITRSFEIVPELPVRRCLPLISTAPSELDEKDQVLLDEIATEFHFTKIESLIKRNDTTKEESDALNLGERILTTNDQIDLEMASNNLTVQPDSPAFKAAINFFGNSSIANINARLGVIDNKATEFFTESFSLPKPAINVLPRFGCFHDCIRRHDALFPHPDIVSCPDNPYRNLNGSCNNLIPGRFDWGTTFTCYRRDLPANYDDGIDEFRRAVDGGELPSARLISTTINTSPVKPSKTHSILHMTFGQFVDHDFIGTPLAKLTIGGSGIDGIYGTSGEPDIETAPMKCCHSSTKHPQCKPIEIPTDDPFYSCFDQTCMEFVRSARCGVCKGGPKQMINRQTTYLDGSGIYGVSKAESDGLRTSVNGLLSGQTTKEGEFLLPAGGVANDGCNTPDKIEMDEFCFKAGDNRVNEQILLTFFHTLWAREHNRVARFLVKCTPDCWEDEDYFQEARRIVWAEWQHIVYNEYLPTVIGPALMVKQDMYPKKGNQFTNDYNIHTNAEISVAFATAAYRFGHSLISNNLLYVTKHGKVEPKELSTLYFNPFDLYIKDHVNDIARGGISLPESRFDTFFSPEITGKLFRGNQKFGLDLLALNIQRGRDHGLPSYNTWRKFCGYPEAGTFDDLLIIEPIIQKERVENLKKVYGHVDDIDLYVGGVNEDPLEGAIVGPTFACLITTQFKRLKIGDRYWFEYENARYPFTPSQLEQLHRSSLARIMCNNLPELEYIQRYPLETPGPDNPKVCCKNIRDYNLEPWCPEFKEYEVIEEEEPHIEDQRGR